jgi:hypothetical protein
MTSSAAALDVEEAISSSLPSPTTGENGSSEDTLDWDTARLRSRTMLTALFSVSMAFEYESSASSRSKDRLARLTLTKVQNMMLRSSERRELYRKISFGCVLHLLQT